MKRPGPIVEIEWEDSTGHSHWHEPSEAYALRRKLGCRTVGYLIHEDKRSVTIIQGTGSVGNYLAAMAIPRSAIRKMERLP